MTGKSELLSNT